MIPREDAAQAMMQTVFHLVLLLTTTTTVTLLEMLRTHYSTTYGINYCTSLLDIKHYSIFNGGLPHDIMYDIMEGTTPTEIKLLLSHCLSSKYFTLNDYNKLMFNFNFENDKPEPILSTVFTKFNDLP